MPGSLCEAQSGTPSLIVGSLEKWVAMIPPNSSALEGRLETISSTPLSKGFCCWVAWGLTGGKAIKAPSGFTRLGTVHH